MGRHRLKRWQHRRAGQYNGRILKGEKQSTCQSRTAKVRSSLTIAVLTASAAQYSCRREPCSARPGLLPPSPPAEKATACQHQAHQARQTCADDWAGNGGKIRGGTGDIDRLPCDLIERDSREIEASSFCSRSICYFAAPLTEGRFCPLAECGPDQHHNRRKQPKDYVHPPR